MRKSIILSLLAVVMVWLGGCGGVSNSDYQTVISERENLKRELKNLQANVASLIDENNALKNELKEQKQEAARLRGKAAVGQAGAEAAKSKEGPRFYEVKSGDSLWKIARRFQVPLATLQKLNNLRGAKLKIGQQILLRQAP
ncbi:MAG: LysM peptidoglycan-binding domain-containing protein [Desulfobacterales bacterium]|nr:LysM peptidoglycan-binding domain-containing protein [Desulfobacterales bacterium]